MARATRPRAPKRWLRWLAKAQRYCPAHVRSFSAWEAPARLVLRLRKAVLHHLNRVSFTQLERAPDSWQAVAAAVGDCCEAARAIACPTSARHPRGRGPLANRLRREHPDEIDLQVQRMSHGAGRDAGHDRQLFLGAVSAVAAGALTAHAGVVERASAALPGRAAVLHHGPLELRVHQQSGKTDRAQPALGRQGRQPSPGLAGEADGQEPSRQRRLAVFQRAPRSRRRLVPTTVAPEDLARAVRPARVFASAAPREPEAVRPPRPLGRPGALRLGAEAGPEFEVRHAVLEQGLAVGQGLRSGVRDLPVMASMAHGMGLAEAHFQSGHRFTTRAGIVTKAKIALMKTHPARRYMPPSVLCVRSFMNPTA